MVLGQIIQYYKGSTDIYQFINLVVRTDKGVFLEPYPLPVTLNEYHSIVKSFEFFGNNFLMRYDGETIEAE